MKSQAFTIQEPEEESERSSLEDIRSKVDIELDEISSINIDTDEAYGDNKLIAVNDQENP